jgi:hypothetical protein
MKKPRIVKSGKYYSAVNPETNLVQVHTRDPKHIVVLYYIMPWGQYSLEPMYEWYHEPSNHKLTKDEPWIYDTIA